MTMSLRRNHGNVYGGLKNVPNRIFNFLITQKQMLQKKIQNYVKTNLKLNVEN